MTNGPIEVLTVGHSTLSYERFVGLLRSAAVTAIADVRTTPYSRHFPHFNRKPLTSELRLDGIAYAFLGEELGGRPASKEFFRSGVADYERMAQTNNFIKGLNRIIDGARSYRIAMMCSEHDPLDCHRCLLVGRALHERGLRVKHILHDGTLTEHSDIEKELLELSGVADDDLFLSQHAQLEIAYRRRAAKVAFELSDMKKSTAAE